MQEKSLVSVIVPVYKVEPYLRECLDSIITQTYTNLEIILVDDGSPDNSGQICEDYARKDSRITVYHKENGGLSDARNYGIDRCNGEYITFVDSDDVLKSNFVSTLMELIEQYDADAATSSVQRFHELPVGGGGINSIFEYREIHTRVLSSVEVLEEILYQQRGTGSTYSLYKRKIYADIRFPVGLYYEDLAVTLKVHLLCRRVAVTNEYMYGYRHNPTSIIQNEYSPKMLAVIPVTRQLYDGVCASVPNLKVAAASRAFSACRMVYFKIPFNMKEERRKIWAEMVRYRTDIIRDPKARKRERLAALCTYLGSSLFHVLFSGAYRRWQRGC